MQKIQCFLGYCGLRREICEGFLLSLICMANFVRKNIIFLTNITSEGFDVKDSETQQYSLVLFILSGDGIANIGE